MKANVHPKYHQVTVICTCGNEFQTNSTVDSDTIKIEVCNKCHPFYTGTQKIMDVAGKVTKFHNRYGNLGKSDKTDKK